MLYCIVFIVSGFLGWVIDTGYRSLEVQRFATATVIPFFSIAYATASLGLYFIFRNWKTYFAVQVILGGVLCVLLELLGGVIIENFFGKRLWDYSDGFLNFRGYIDLKHSVYWLLLTLMYRIIFGFLPVSFRRSPALTNGTVSKHL